MSVTPGDEYNSNLRKPIRSNASTALKSFLLTFWFLRNSRLMLGLVYDRLTGFTFLTCEVPTELQL